ncbi:MAG: hypothetical protein H7301_00980 [Cryobacterium sp.]|nr:hypothetical protein [Oligoflexia bacterium]
MNAFPTEKIDTLSKEQISQPIIREGVLRAVEKYGLVHELDNQRRLFRQLAETLPQIVWMPRPEGRNIYSSQ